MQRCPCAARSEIQPIIPLLTAKGSVDMLVMGACAPAGMMLGGVTREMLRTMTLPTLICTDARRTRLQLTRQWAGDLIPAPRATLRAQLATGRT